MKYRRRRVQMVAKYPSRIVQLFGVSLSLLFAITLIASYTDDDGMKQTLHQVAEEQARRTHLSIINEFMKDRENWTTSILGSWLFKYDKHVVPQNSTFLIYINRDEILAKDHLKSCSVKNCIFVRDNPHLLQIADAVLIHLQRDIIPQVKRRRPQQRWILLNDESPKNLFARPQKRKPVVLKDLANVFNWSMTYRSDSDIPVTYGRTIPLARPIFKNLDTSSITEIIPYWKRKRRDVLVTILLSHCSVKFRIEFIEELQKHMPVDVFGTCSKNKTLQYRCPGHYKEDCDAISEYLFYLALENSDCREYMTEKIWYNGYTKGAIPVIMGPPLNDCKRLLPPNSFLYIPLGTNSSKIEELAKKIIRLNENDDSLLSLHHWRNHFITVNEHGYFGRKSTRYCRLCEGLNYNDVGEKIYSERDIQWFFDPTLSCGK